ncbi:MAG: amidohydrolase family protein [Chloroflexi bacterium]|nr:amidohydrolase family protein [Chloroflexota bacterium]MQC16908.1 amidohydrolase [Chloroflexota bacterium]
MLVDIHTHIFPPRFIAHRDQLATRDPAFGAIYGNPRAGMATADDLLVSMRDAEIDVSVACGFWWSDAELAAEHAAYLVDVAAASDGAILAFAPSDARIPGATGIGEVREARAEAIPVSDLPVLVHCSEEVGHQYHGKAGGLTPSEIWRLLEAQPDARIIAAHWGGGFPFYGLMPEVREVVDSGRLLFDTAASHYLYRPAVFSVAVELVGASAIAWGSDFPLRQQSVDLAEAQRAIADKSARALILGGNAARLLGLPSEA